MVITGGQEFSNLREKIKIVNHIKNSFNGKAQIEIDGNLVHYTAYVDNALAF